MVVIRRVGGYEELAQAGREYRGNMSQIREVRRPKGGALEMRSKTG